MFTLTLITLVVVLIKNSTKKMTILNFDE
ncbi:hypothetical protein [Leuconostoc pseudomesenteroides]